MMCIALDSIAFDYESERVVPAIVDQSGPQLRGCDLALIRTSVRTAPAQADSHLQYLTIRCLHTQELCDCSTGLRALVVEN
ncbi:hypothetical protein WL38_20320 [Burkholderia ubonensis]|nr:hypothetical protein WL38_20320 [Burkholderia ubonensis]